MRILVLGDFHAPYHSKPALAWVIKLAKKLKPTHIVQVGDLYDMFAYSRYPKLLKLTPGQEVGLARRATEELWDLLPKNCKRYQLLGNHDDRPLKRALAVAPELAPLIGKTLDDLYTYPGVTLVKEAEFELEGLLFQHGHRAKLGDHARYNQCSTVVGHSHVGGCVFLRNRNGVFYELNAGFLGDIETQAFSYLSQKKINTTTLGVGFIDDAGPRFIPFDKNA